MRLDEETKPAGKKKIRLEDLKRKEIRITLEGWDTDANRDRVTGMNLATFRTGESCNVQADHESGKA